jgi:carbonic anhydrase/acetyltransferase-like protein (isoleucine patch superfamily)
VIDLAPDVFVADAVQAYGAIRVGAGSSLWPNAVLRAECQQIRIGRMSNIQDFVMVHVGYDAPSVIGDFCSIAHHATIHGATIGHDVLVGIGAVVMDGARIGAASILAGTPARVLKTRDCSHANRLNAWLYHRNADAYRQGHHRAWCGEDFDRWKAAKWAQIQADRDLDEFPRG